MPSASAIKAGEAYVEVGVRQTALERGLRAAEQRIKKFGAQLRTVGAGLVGAAGPLTAGLAAAVKIFADVGGALTDVRDRTGMSIEAWTELAHHFGLAGASAQDLEAAIRRMQMLLGAAAQGNRAAAQTLALLGLRFEELARLAPDQQLERIGDALAGVANEAQRTQLATAVFGRGGVKLLPGLLAGVGAGRRQARALGLTISDADANAADRLGDALQTLAEQARVAAFAIGAALAPYVQAFVDAAQPVLAWVIDFARRNGDLVATVAAVAGGVTAFGAALLAVGAAAAVVAPALGAVAAIAGVLLSPLGLLAAAGVAVAVALGPELWPTITSWWEWGRDLLLGVYDRIRAELEAAGVTWQLWREQAIFAIEAIPPALQWLWDSLQAVAAWIADDWPRIFTDAAALIGETFQSLVRLAGAAWQQIVGVFEGRWPDFGELSRQFGEEMARLTVAAARVVRGLELPEFDVEGINPERLARIRRLQAERDALIEQALDRFRREREAGPELPGGEGARAAARMPAPWRLVQQAEEQLTVSAGAFAAAAAQSLAVGDSLAKQQVDLLREVNEHLERIEQNTEEGFS